MRYCSLIRAIKSAANGSSVPNAAKAQTLGQIYGSEVIIPQTSGL